MRSRNLYVWKAHSGDSDEARLQTINIISQILR